MNMLVLGPGKISFGIPVMDVDVETGLIEVDDSDMEDYVSVFTRSQEAEITMEATLTTKQHWLLMTGQMVTNNWLKMHGGVMERKSYRERRKR